jgi:hypothetical protein
VAKTNRRRAGLGVVGTLILLVFIARISLWAAGPTTTLPSPPTPGRFTLAIKSGGYDRVANIHIPKGYRESENGSDPVGIFPLGVNHPFRFKPISRLGSFCFQSPSRPMISSKVKLVPITSRIETW